MSEYSDHTFDVKSSNNSWTHIYSYIKKNSRILDIGCSSGLFGEELIKSKECKVIGIDIDDDDIKEAKKHLDEAYVMDVNGKEIANLGKFDVIIFADVLEHLVDPRQTLRNIKKLLNPAGIVAFSLPHMAHISVRLELLSGKFPYKNKGLLDKTHLHFYDTDELDSMFKDAGYKIKQMNPVVSEYPDGLIEEKLKEIGLTPTPKFKKTIEETNANIFQLVGYAAPDDKVKKSETLNYIMPQDEIKAYAQKIIVENKKLWEEQQKYRLELEELKNEVKDQTELVNSLRASPISTVSKLMINKVKHKASGKNER